MSTLFIKNATIVNEGEEFVGSLVVKSGKIEEEETAVKVQNRVVSQTQMTVLNGSAHQQRNTDDATNNLIVEEVPDEERCQIGGDCPYRARYVCRAYYCCDDYGCERQFCPAHRSIKCFMNDNFEPWPQVCV